MIKYENLTIFLVIFLFIIGGMSGVASLLNPWLLLLSEFIKAIRLPSFLTSEKILQWEFKGIHTFFKHQTFYSQEYKDKQYIKCLMPHGIMPFTIWCLWGENNFFNRKDNTFVTTHQLYEFPFISHYAIACNAIPSNYTMMEKVLQEKKSLIVYPGGLREMFSCSHKKEVVVIKKRRGIFYMALSNGVPLLPVYTFGITTLYEKSGVSITLPFFFKNDKDNIAWYYGQYNTPFPLQKKLITVVGNPITVEKKDIITNEDIEELRNRYIHSVKELYNNWCHKYDSGKIRKLYIK